MLGGWGAQRVSVCVCVCRRGGGEDGGGLRRTQPTYLCVYRHVGCGLMDGVPKQVCAHGRHRSSSSFSCCRQCFFLLLLLLLLPVFPSLHCRLYTIISSIDLPYMCSYAFLLSGLLSMASVVAPFEFCKYFNLLPLVAVLFDAAENTLILSMLQTYPDLVDLLAPVVPFISQWKWNFLFLCVSLMAGSGMYCCAVAAGLAGKQRKQRSKGSSAADGSAAQQQDAGSRDGKQKQQRRQKRA